jgi:5-methyltetrahydropteroyltriglutamate--homocysteine methyltransferase
MGLTTTVVGSYPKPPDEGKPFVVRKTLHAIERGDATADDLRAAQDDLVSAIIGEQEAAGIDIVTDGQARWDDILTPFASNIAGFEIGPLLRLFDNNVYYRRPVCTGAVEWRGPSSVEAFNYASSVATRPVKAVIPGPITFARLSLDEHYYDHGRFVYAIAEVLAQEAAELEAAGARYIQIDEPALLGAPEDLALATNAVEAIASGLAEAHVLVATYFGDAKRLGTELFRLPAQGFGLDFAAGPENVELLPDVPQGTTIQAGVLDARNTRLEDPAEVASLVERLLEHVAPENLWLSPSAGLEFLPREKARAKLQRLADIAKEVG